MNPILNSELSVTVVLKNGVTFANYAVTHRRFPAGEIYLDKLPDIFDPKNPHSKDIQRDTINCITILAFPFTMDDVIALLMLKDFLDSYSDKINLKLGYLPYARQDRKKPGIHANEVNSLKLFSKIINAQKFNEVVLVDPHSDVSAAVFDNSRVITRLQCLNEFRELHPTSFKFLKKPEDVVLISPDAGAYKATYEIAEALGLSDVVMAEKVRDIKTGEILRTRIHDHEKLKDKHVLVIDDLCDGGRTFTEIAIAIKKQSITMQSFNLYITHGLFTKGPELLLEHFNSVYAYYDHRRNEPRNLVIFNSRAFFA